MEFTDLLLNVISLDFSSLFSSSDPTEGLTRAGVCGLIVTTGTAVLAQVLNSRGHLEKFYGGYNK